MVDERILNQMRLIKQQIDDLYTMVKSLEAKLSCPLLIGVIPTIGPYLLPKIYPMFANNIVI